MSAALPQDIQSALSEAVSSGRYGSEHEFLREAIALMTERDLVRERRVEDLAARVEQGRQAVLEGRSRFVSCEEMKRLARAQYDQRKT